MANLGNPATIVKLQPKSMLMLFLGIVILLVLFAFARPVAARVEGVVNRGFALGRQVVSQPNTTGPDASMAGL